MDKNLLMAGLVGILLVVSVFQAFQLNGLNEKIKEASVATAASTASVQVQTQAAPAQQAPASGATLPSNLQNLPSQVGGC